MPRLLAALLAFMTASHVLASFLVEQSKRRPSDEVVAAVREEAEAMAATLRSRFDQHPKQRRFWQSLAKRLAALCTRRAGKSDGGVHEWLAKAITISGWRGVYINTTRQECMKIVWKNDLQMGWVDLLKRHGEVIDENTYRIGGVIATTNKTELTIDFSNGSQIAIFAADDEAALGKLRGQAKDEIWIDEAQKFPHLRKLVVADAGPLVKDKKGVIRLTGTPSEDAAGYFYDVTPEPESGDTPLAGWEVHRWSVTDNPGFGCVAWIDGQWFVTDRNGVELGGPYVDEQAAEAAAVDIRWRDTAGEALAENGWTPEEPDFIREWLGKWCKTDARYVYPVHVVPAHVLTYAPQRLTDPLLPGHAPWYDHARALRDLPRKSRGQYEWMFAIGADFGYAQTPFALTMWAFTFDRPDIFEMISWKQHKVLPDDQRMYIDRLWSAVDNVIVLVGDPAGQKAADLEAWRTRFSLPIDDADKSAKNTWQELMAGDIRKGNVHYREGSPLLHECKHLVYLPTKPGKSRKDDEFRRISDGTVPGNDCADAGLYAYRYLQHHLHRDAPPDPRTEAQRLGDAHEEQLDRMQELRDALEAAGELDPYDADGGYTWG